MGMRKTALEGEKSKHQRCAAVKQEPSDDDVLTRLRSSASSPTTESDMCREYAHDNDYYDYPMDLSKKSSRSPGYQSGDECDCTQTEGGSSHPSINTKAINYSKQNAIPNALSATAMEGPVLEALYLPNNDNASSDVVLHMWKEEARSETPAQGSLTNELYNTYSTLSRPLRPRRLSAQEEQQKQRWQDAGTPEVFSPHNTPPPLADNQDREVTSTASFPKLFEVTNESLLERLARVRCKSDSDIENPCNSSSPRPASSEVSSSPLPRHQRSPSPTLKRRAFTGITDRYGAPTEDEASWKQPRIHDEVVFNPVSPLCSTTCYLEAPQETFFQQLRQLGPAPLPLSYYAYDTHITQRLLEHELLRRHLEAMAASGGLPSQLLPPEMLASGMAPGLNSVEPDELGVDAANQTESYSGGEQKRASRALTGKHIKQGTGASPSTLLTLREKIRERQRARQLGVLEPRARPLKGCKAKKGCDKGSSNGKKPTSK